MPLFAKAAVSPDNEIKLVNLISKFEECALPYIVTGGLSNLLFKNGFYNGIVVKTDKIATKSLAENRVTLGCGVRMSGINEPM